MHVVVIDSSVDEGPGQRLVERIQQHFPGSYPLADGRVHLVRSPDVAELVARKLEISGKTAKGAPDRAKAAVIKLNNSWSGFGATSLWDWLGGEQ